jgi:hypothetical protein
MPGNVDRGGQNDRPRAAGLSTPRQVIVPRYNRSTMLDRAPILFEITGPDWFSILLVAEHHGIVVVKNDPGIVPAQPTKVEPTKAGCFEKDNKFMTARLPDQMQSLPQARPPRTNGGDLDAGGAVPLNTVD